MFKATLTKLPNYSSLSKSPKNKTLSHFSQQNLLKPQTLIRKRKLLQNMAFQKLLHGNIFHLRILGIIKVPAIFPQIRFSVCAPECKASVTLVSF